MGAIEPGEKYEYEYAAGKKVTIVGLSFREQKAMAKIEDELNAAEGAAERMEIIERGLKSALPHLSDDEHDKLLDDINMDHAGEIYGAVMGRLSDEERKKLAPLP